MPYFFAWRFLRSITSEKTISTMLVVCFVSIALATGSLALVAAIMQGFQETTYKKFQGIHSDIIVESPDHRPIKHQKFISTLTHTFPDSIASATPYANGHALLQTSDSNDFSHIVMIQGIDPHTDAQTRALASTLTKNKNFEKCLKKNTIIVGSSLAENLNITHGATVSLLLPDDSSKRSRTLSFTEEEVTVSDLFKTGIEDLDASTLFCSLETFNKLFPHLGVAQIGIKLKTDVNPEDVCPTITEQFGFPARPWYTLYPALLSALTLEKYAMILVLAIMTIIASTTIVSLLYMYITQKQNVITLLQTMGMHLREIRLIFTIIGMTICSSACILGLLGAWLISWIMEHYQLIKLPDAYYTDYVPAHMHVSLLLVVFIAVCLVSLLTTWLSTKRIASTNLAKNLSITNMGT